MDVSLVIPLYNEDESIKELYAWIVKVANANSLTYEIIFVNDGSTDNSWNVIEELSAADSNVHGIKFRRNYGKSAALYCGFKKAQGDVVITTKLFNATARKVSGINNLHDFNCGLKAYRRDVIKNIEVYGEMHRYIPYLAKNAGFDKIGEKVVHHQARKFGHTKFGGLNRFFNGYLDLLSLWFLTSFGRKPMHVFGFLGSLMFFIGFVAIVIVGANKIYALCNNIPAHLVTDSPYFYIALTMMLLGTQLFLAGFLGELVSRNASARNDYKIEKEI